MDQKKLEKISIIVVLAGLIFLYIIANDITPNILPETKIDPTKTVTITGIVQNSKQVEKALFLTIDAERREETNVIIFSSEPIGVKMGDHVEITGTTQIRNSKEEIIADEIKLK